MKNKFSLQWRTFSSSWFNSVHLYWSKRKSSILLTKCVKLSRLDLPILRAFHKLHISFTELVTSAGSINFSLGTSFFEEENKTSWQFSHFTLVTEKRIYINMYRIHMISTWLLLTNDLPYNLAGGKIQACMPILFLSME